MSEMPMWAAQEHARRNAAPAASEPFVPLSVREAIRVQRDWEAKCVRARLKAWADLNPSADTQGIEDDEWLAMAYAALGEPNR